MKKLLLLLLAPLIGMAQPTPVSGVGKIVAGTNVTISPTSGTGPAVTINATGGGGGGTPGGSNLDWQYNNLGSFGGYTPATGWVNLFTTPTSALMRAWITDESGTGALLFAGGNIGAATATSLNGVTIAGGSTPALTVTGTTSVSGANTGDQSVFKTFAVSGQTDVTATTTTDTATLVAGNQVTITTSGKNITISSSGSGSPAPNTVFFSSTANGANNATASDVSIIGSGVGSKTTLANYFSAGTTLMIHVAGTIATAATPDNLTIKIKAGSTTVGSASGVSLTGLLSGSTFEMWALVTCRTAGASGTFSVNSIFAVTGSALTPLEAKLTNSGSAIDTTGTLAWDVTAAWASTTAGDIITGTNFAMWTPGQNTDDTPWASSWNGVTTQAPSKNAVYDWGHTFDTDDDGKVNVLDQDAGVPVTNSSGVLQTPITTYAGLLSAISDLNSATATLTNKTLTAPVISTISNTGTVTLPTSTDTLVGRATTDTLTNKTLTSPTISNPTVTGTQTMSGGAATIDASSGDGTISATGGGKWIISATSKFTGAVQDSAGGVGASGQVLKSNGSGVLTYGNNSGSYVLRLQGSPGSVAASVTTYAGWSAGVSTTSQGRYKVYIPKTGTIKAVNYYWYGAAGDSGHNLTVDVLLNGTTSVGSANGASNVFPTFLAATGLSQAVTGNGISGDYIELRVVSPSGMTTVTSMVAVCDVYIETAL